MDNFFRFIFFIIIIPLLIAAPAYFFREYLTTRMIGQGSTVITASQGEYLLVRIDTSKERVKIVLCAKSSLTSCQILKAISSFGYSIVTIPLDYPEGEATLRALPYDNQGNPANAAQYSRPILIVAPTGRR